MTVGTVVGTVVVIMTKAVVGASVIEVTVVSKVATAVEVSTNIVEVLLIVEVTCLVVVSVTLATEALPVSLCFVVELERECFTESSALELVGKVKPSITVMFVGKLRENKSERREYHDRNNN